MFPISALVALAVGCSSGDGPQQWQDAGAYRWIPLHVRGRQQGGFTQLSSWRTGLEFANGLSQEMLLGNRHLAHGSGVALGDADGDGLLDVYLARTDGPNALYRNRGNWRFEEIAEQVGVAAPNRFSTGAAFADVNGNGRLDLIVTSLGGPNALFVNDGNGRFTEQVQEAGLASNRGSTTVALADVDGDGFLDMYIANYKVASVRDLFPPEARTSDQVIRRRGDEYTVASAFAEHYRVAGVDELGRPVWIERADPDWFYLNDGAGHFRPVPFTAGHFLDEEGKPYAQQPGYFALAARFHDVNGDGHPDLYVANDFSGPDQFWLNDGSGKFRAAPQLAIRSMSHASMAVDFSDIDRDGETDFFVVDMLAPRSSPRRKTQIRTNPPPQAVGEIENRPQVQRNSLYLNRGDGTFAQIADLAGVEASEWSWATLMMDVDLDGYEDILVTTGHVWDVLDSDTHEQLATSFPSVGWPKGLLAFPPLRARNFAFRNRGDLTFEDMSRRWGFGRVEDVSHGMAAGDLDGDGDLDVVVNRFGSPVAVLRNDAGAPRIAVRLVGNPPNTQGVGARVKVRGGPVALQQDEVTIGGLYLSSSEPMSVFATGGAERVTIEVDWPNGDRTVVEDARPNRLYEIRQVPKVAPGTAPAAAPEDGAERYGWGVEPLFADRSAELDHSHADAPFDDFARQPLLPNRLSRFGPGVSLYDVDRDGYEDVLIASGRGGTLGYLRNEGGRIAQRIGLTSPAAFDQTTILGMPSGRGGTAILVGQASHEAATLRDALAYPSVLRIEEPGGGEGETRVSAAVPGDTSVVGPLALADVNGNGELDLFVGGRMLPAAYPLPASARLFLNTGGRFELDPVNSATFRSLGLVSAALFSDVDGDGDPDLILAIEWGPIRVFLNREGRFVEATESLGLSSHVSRWNGVATGDLDGDGRLDIIATSWGRNTEYHASATNPLYLYHGDFDQNGSMDIVLAQFDERLKDIAPLTSRTRLVAAMPALASRIRSFGDYANATIERAIGPPLRWARRLEADTFDHMLFLNRDATFDAVPLPLQAQLAPAFYAGVADFDGNGNEDVFLSQNFFATDIMTPRHDAGRGLLLLGDGSGGLAPVPGHASGIAVYGEQRGAAFGDLDRDGRTDLVVSQNGAPTRLFLNQRAAPGLRVRLLGHANNPDGFGATIRVVYENGRGPAREVQAGSGYWAQNGPVQVMGLRDEPIGVWVRWPGGEEQEVRLTPGSRDIMIHRPPNDAQSAVP